MRMKRLALIELSFTLPSASCSPGTLIANGYYVPLGSR
jgi:hypothetical protein